jgi:cell shape-determining protein MreD
VTRARIVAAIAGIVTALLLQATVLGPALAPAMVSLPAVLVAAVALADGPATGMSFGFSAGLVADLGSRHPAGVLALCWLGVGLLCGTLATRPGLGRDALVAGIVTAVAAVVAGALLVVVHEGGTLRSVLAAALPTLIGDVVLALPAVALVRRMLRTESLRAPRPVLTELAVGGRRG